jgi:hypothetical protein
VTQALTLIVVWLNAVANALGRLLDPIGALPGWVSITLIAMATGACMLLVFKYTSNQQAIRKSRRTIRANLLAGRLFRDDIRVGLRAQLRVFRSAAHLLALALVPMAVMLIPTALLLGQLALWYELAPVPVGEDVVVTIKFNGETGSPMPEGKLAASDALEDVSGPVQIASKGEVCWNVRARRPGYHALQFRIGDQTAEKEVAVGTGVMRVSPSRPEWNWWKALQNPRERPFAPDSIVKSIEIEYPTRPSWPSGTNHWLWYWFLVSLIAGFCFRGPLRVSI